jgi:hypothetical protein
VNLRVGRISKVIFPNHASCKKCNTTWGMVKEHVVEMSESAGCFALCEKCWEESNHNERLSLYLPFANTEEEYGMIKSIIDKKEGKEK